MACVLSILGFLCGRLTDAFATSLQSQAEGGFSFLGDLAGRGLRDRVLQWLNRVALQQTVTTALIGADGSLSVIRNHLSSDEVDVVGIVGMGGVGKTTLLKKINNDLYWRGAGKFDVVIFATVSQEGNALTVQKQIVDRLGLQSADSEYRAALYSNLSKRRFLLLLDDLWGGLDLNEIGIPLPDRSNRCKIAITTRSSAVFGKFMGTWCDRRRRARMVDVSPLDDARSWELFCRMLDAQVDLDDPDIRPHARKLVQKCNGLPLALVTMGGAMAAATSPAQWRKAVARLAEDSTYRLEGMDKVYSNLAFSIDMLGEGTLLSCFLYCGLFPEDYNIPEERLVDYWIAEGFLDQVRDERPRRRRSSKGVDDNIWSARDEGQIVIQKLKDVHLLETAGEEQQCRCVKMHDLVREVALELGRRDGNRFLVRVERRDPCAIEVDEWEEATRVSLMHSKIAEGSIPDQMPNCPVMSTLLMAHAVLPRELPDGFFNSMHTLVVLDLSWCAPDVEMLDLWSFPTSICSLGELRYLNLDAWAINSLPRELGDLAKLRQLHLRSTLYLENIPHQAISRLSCLQVLSMEWSHYAWVVDQKLGSGHDVAGGAGDDEEDCGRQLCVSDLHGLKQLQDIRINIKHRDVLLSMGLSLLRSVTRLRLHGISDLATGSLSSALRGMSSLRELRIRECENLTGELVLDGSVLCHLEVMLFYEAPLSAIVVRSDGEEQEDGALPLQKLREVEMWGCHGLKDLQWVSKLHQIESIYVRSCEGMEGLLSSAGGGRGGGMSSTMTLPKLRTMHLECLPKLRSICDSLHCLPSLECLQVSDCPLLRALPLGHQSMIREIKCSKQWWEALEWRRDQRDVHAVAASAVQLIGD